MKRIEQKENREKQILDVALNLFVEKGFAATRITDIAKAANMSKGLMFNYFSSKERLYEVLIQKGIEKSNKLLENTCDEPLDFFIHVAEMIINGAKYNQNVAKMFVLINDASRSDFLPDEIRLKLRRENITKSAEIISKGQKQGTIRAGDPIALSATFWAAVTGIFQLAIQNSEFIYPEPYWLVDIIRAK